MEKLFLISVESVLQKLQLNEILDKEVALLHTLNSQIRGKINRDKPRFTSGTEKTPISASMQCNTGSNEGVTNISSSSGPRLETLELSKISDTVSNLPALSEKLNSTLINIRKIRDRNTCEVAEYQREAAKRKTTVKDRNRKRKVGVTSSSSEAMKVESDTGIDNLKKKTRMNAMTKKNVQGMKIYNTKHNLVSVTSSAKTQSSEKLKESDYLKQRFSFRINPPQKTASIVHDMETFTAVKGDDASCNQHTHSPAKMSSSTFQKLQQFKRTYSDIHSVSQNISESKESFRPMSEVPNSRKDRNTDGFIKEFESFNDLVTCGKKLSDSQQSSGSGLGNNDGLISLDRNVSKLFSTGDDIEDLDFEI